VISRPGTPVQSMGERLPMLRPRFRDPGGADDPAPGGWIYLIDAPTPAVSSTEIRRRLRGGESIQGMVPADVELHIRRHGLYLETSTADHLQ
jgi:nicotinic acid mononucleotide adenylyltransferase